MAGETIPAPSRDRREDIIELLETATEGDRRQVIESAIEQLRA
jgi:hypothetical protein